MKLQRSQADGSNRFTAYGEGYVSVNAIRHTANILVLPDRLIPAWTPANFSSLTVADFERLAALDAGILLLGTGNRLRFPRQELLKPLIRAHKGLEVMDLPAACRTFNVLASEGRSVAAAILFS